MICLAPMFRGTSNIVNSIECQKHLILNMSADIQYIIECFSIIFRLHLLNKTNTHNLNSMLMKTKTLLFTIFFIISAFSVQSTELLVSEDFASDAWQAELLAQDPAYLLPATTGANYAVNSTVLYHGKYYLNGAIMIDGVTTVRTCADSITHPENGIEHKESTTGYAVAFRFRGAKADPNVGTYMEFPELPNAGLMTLHVRCANPTAGTKLVLQQYDASTSEWTSIYTFELRAYNEFFEKSLDEIVSYDINSTSAIKLRVVGGSKFTYLYRVDIAEYVPTAVKSTIATPLKIANRKITANEPIKISLYNLAGMLVFESKENREIEIPTSVGNGLFMIKSNQGAQKIMLK